jgi:hypothetical protein
MTTNKLLIGVGAIALAATASLSPLVAQAEPAGDTDSSASADTGSVGNAAGRKAARTNRGGAAGTEAGAPSQSTVGAPPQSVVSGARPATAPGANALGPNPLFQNPLWWFGTPNPNPPPAVASRNFDALASLPGWAQGYYGWYEDLNFEACVLGLGSTISPNVGPYGNSTSSISTGGC